MANGEERYQELSMSSLSGKYPSWSVQGSNASGATQGPSNVTRICVTHRCLLITVILFIVLVVIDTGIILFLTVKVFNMSSQYGTSDHIAGPPGPIGPRGPPGPPGVTGQEPCKGGAVYTRWGRTSCPHADVDLLYAGVVGGAHYTHAGSGANYLCLPLEPEWMTYKDGAQYSSGRALIYGTEYQSPDDIYRGKDLLNDDVPCAVCQTQHRFNSSWVMEYKGYLMAQHYEYKGKTMFECMDEDPETIQGGGKNENGALFYPTEAYCGSLPCPNYVGGRELTCVVCSL